MALNEINRDGFSLSYNFGTSDPSIASGEFVWITAGIRGVAETAAVERADGDWYATIRTIGVFQGTTADAVTEGAALYIAAAATNGTALTTTAGSNKLIGYAVGPKGSGAGNINVRINN